MNVLSTEGCCNEQVLVPDSVLKDDSQGEADGTSQSSVGHDELVLHTDLAGPQSVQHETLHVSSDKPKKNIL